MHVMRYAMLTALTVAAVWGVIVLSTSDAQPLMADVGHTAALGTPGNRSFWLLAAVAALITFSLCRFAIFALPSLIGQWCAVNKMWVYLAVIGGAYGVFYLM